MAVIKELLRSEADGSISFGNYELSEKSKLDDFAHQGDIYKVKTFGEITKLEKNGMFLYESVPGTTVSSLKMTDSGISFTVEGKEDAQITIGLEDDCEYDVTIDGEDHGQMKSNMSGKIMLSVELDEGKAVSVSVSKK
ncbi:MAG: endosialidase [Eubacterium sp.]|nr:endosialidase [Eubacterium sp.]